MFCKIRDMMYSIVSHRSPKSSRKPLPQISSKIQSEHFRRHAHVTATTPKSERG